MKYYKQTADSFTRHLNASRVAPTGYPHFRREQERVHSGSRVTSDRRWIWGPDPSERGRERVAHHGYQTIDHLGGRETL